MVFSVAWGHHCCDWNFALIHGKNWGAAGNLPVFGSSNPIWGLSSCAQSLVWSSMLQAHPQEA
eukprot:6350048-Prorocentrum_lima.AAC.1